MSIKLVAYLSQFCPEFQRTRELNCKATTMNILLDLILRYHYQSSLTFPNLSNQEDIHSIEDPEHFRNSKGKD